MQACGLRLAGNGCLLPAGECKSEWPPVQAGGHGIYREAV